MEPNVCLAPRDAAGGDFAMRRLSRTAVGLLLVSCLPVCVVGCGRNENERAVFETVGNATAEEKAKPPPSYPTSQEEYNKYIAPKGPPGSYGKTYPFARGANRKLLKGEEPPKKKR
jgi:hypothetical protein